MRKEDDIMMVHFPWLHPGLAHGPLPKGVVLFDPGLTLDSKISRWRPDNLPLGETELRRLVREYVDFAEGLARPSDLRPYEAAGLEDFYTDTAMDIRSQLQKGTIAEGDPEEDRRRKAQIVLALALSREEQFIALHEQEDRLEHARNKFAASLGLEDEETFSDQGIPDALIFPRAGSGLPWKDLFGPFVYFIPQGTRLFVSDPDVAEELLALGLPREPCGADIEDFVCLRVCPRDLDLAGDEDLSAVVVVQPEP